MILSTSTGNLKKRIMISLDSLPPEGLREVVNFLDYVRFKFQEKSQPSTPYQPVAFGGLWKDENMDAKDIDEVRREMWQNFEDREL